MNADDLASTAFVMSSPSVPRLLLAWVTLVGVLLAIIVAAGAGTVWKVRHVGPLGDCARIGLCVRTPLATVEQRTGVQLPAGAERIKSSASRDGSYVSALVRLPEGAAVPTLQDSAAAELTNRAAAALRSMSAHHLAGRTAGHVGLFTGTANGTTVLFLRYDTTLG